MLRYTIRRLLWGLLAIFAVTLAVFVLFGPVMQWRTNITPARIYAGKSPSAEQIKQVEATLGLDKPFYEQYGISVRRLVLGPSETEKERLCPNVSGDECSKLVGRLGRSFQKQRSVDSLIWDRASVTFSLTLVAAVIWLSIAIPVGVLSAIRPRSIFDRVTMVFVLIGQSLPIYYFGLLALYFLAYENDIFPRGGYETFEWSDPWPWLSHLLLPGMTLALQFTALYVRLVRGSLLDALGEDYVRTARAKGASERRTILRHGLRNAILPIVTIFGLDLGILMGGAILTEATFGLPGIGTLSVDAATALDVPLTAGVVLFAAILIVSANIVVDLAYAFVDPRIRLS
jgi:peptide/nickel transport system permease protein